MVFMALATALVLCTRSQDSLLSVSAHRVHAVFSTAGFKGGSKAVSEDTWNRRAAERPPASLAQLAALEPKPLVR